MATLWGKRMLYGATALWAVPNVHDFQFALSGVDEYGPGTMRTFLRSRSPSSLDCGEARGAMAGLVVVDYDLEMGTLTLAGDARGNRRRMWCGLLLASLLAVAAKASGQATPRPVAQVSPEGTPAVAPASAPLERVLANSQWEVTTGRGLRAWGDLSFRDEHSFTTMNGPQGEWRAVDNESVVLGETYLLRFSPGGESFVATQRDGTKVAFGIRKAAVPKPTAVTSPPPSPIARSLPPSASPAPKPSARPAGRR